MVRKIIFYEKRIRNAVEIVHEEAPTRKQKFKKMSNCVTKVVVSVFCPANRDVRVRIINGYSYFVQPIAMSEYE